MSEFDKSSKHAKDVVCDLEKDQNANAGVVPEPNLAVVPNQNSEQQAAAAPGVNDSTNAPVVAGDTENATTAMSSVQPEAAEEISLAKLYGLKDFVVLVSSKAVMEEINKQKLKSSLNEGEVPKKKPKKK